MARFLFTTILADDLGVPTRSMPIALELKRRGHDVAFCNPLNAPAKLEGCGGTSVIADRVEVLATAVERRGSA